MDLKRPTLLERYAKAVVVLFAIATPVLIYTAFQAVQNKTNKVTDWLPKTYVETGDLKWFREHFVGDQFIVVSWEGCRLGDNPRAENAQPDDPRIERLAQMLVPVDGMPEAVGGPPLTHYFKSVTTGRRLLNRLTSKQTDLRYDAAVNRLKGSLIGPDGHQTCVIVSLSDEAIDKFREAIGRGSAGWLQFTHHEGALFKALRACDIDLETVHLGGPPVDSVAIDEEGERTLFRLASLAALVGLLLAWWSLRSIKLTLIVFACGVLSALASLSAVWLTGGTTDAFLLSMPSLVYVLAVSGAVHLIKYYRDTIEDEGPTGAPARAIFLGWKPTLLCSVTTAIGLLALCTSDLAPIRKFGMYSSLGVMMMLVTLFVFLPAALYVWPIGSRKKQPALKLKQQSERQTEIRLFWLDKFWQRFGSWVIRRHFWVTLGCAALIIGVGFGVTRVRTNIDLMKLFASDARVRQDYQWLESNVGRLVPMEVVLKFDPDTLRRDDDTPLDRKRYSLLDRVETVASVQRAIDARFGAAGEDVTGRSISPVTFVPSVPKKRTDARTKVQRSALNSKLKSNYQSLSNTGYLAIDPKDGTELWRISVRVAAFKDVDYAQFANELRQVVDPIVARHCRTLTDNLLASADFRQNEHDDRPALSTVYTGVIPIVYKAQRALLDSLIESTFWSFITITPLLMFVSRGVGAGLVAMLPNSLPVLVVFGGMGWLGFPVTIGSMMSASIALGVAVDDTIHFLMWYRLELDETSDRRKASLAAYRRCATPTLQAALISGIGLSVFGLSTFTPTKQFGLLMLAILLTGVVAELVMIPALLAGPLGRAFQPHKKSGAKPSSDNQHQDDGSIATVDVQAVEPSSRTSIEVPQQTKP